MRWIAVIGLASSVLVGCSSSSDGGTAAEGAVRAIPQPSTECGAVAERAALALENINAWRAEPTKRELVAGMSDRELVRISIRRAESTVGTDSYLVNTESMGGSPCYVYGLQSKSEQIDMTDDGKVLAGGRPSQACSDVAKKAAGALAEINGRKIEITSVDLDAAQWDHELIRVNIRDEQGKADSYLVNTESMGGSPCYVYGLQIRSEETDLRDD